MTTQDRKAAFLRVIDDHRWLAASGCAWNLVGPSGANERRAEAHRLLPNIDVMILDSLLSHSRSLIKFYKSVRRSPTDIVLFDFEASINPSLKVELERYENPIELHLLHLTDLRDHDYRDRNATGDNAKKFRPDWNCHASLIVDLLLKALEYVSERGPWQRPFRALNDACIKRYRDMSSDWPSNLSEKSDVDRYLMDLGL